jgi:alpha-L-rhamnosidase
MRPQPVGDLAFVKATHRSPYGKIKSEWRKASGQFDWQIEIPPNTTATVYVPAASAAAVTESGKPLAKAKGVKLLRAEKGAVVLAVASGEYHFAVR